LPEARDRIALGTIGRQEQTHKTFVHPQGFRCMTAPILQQENIRCPLIVLGKLMQQDLKVDGIQLG